MKSKQYQIIEITIPSGSANAHIKDQLRPDYKYATGLFFHSDKSLAGMRCGIKIDGIEILPNGSIADLFRWTDGVSRNDALWDFTDDRIESSEKSIDINIEMQNSLSYDLTFNLMVLLKN